MLPTTAPVYWPPVVIAPALNPLQSLMLLPLLICRVPPLFKIVYNNNNNNTIIIIIIYVAP